MIDQEKDLTLIALKIYSTKKLHLFVECKINKIRTIYRNIKKLDFGNEERTTM